MASKTTLTRRKLPKLMACMTKTSLENLRNKALFSLDVLDAKGVRRRKLPLHECLICELNESGFGDSSDYLQDLIYDNIQLLEEDEIGIVVDLRKRDDFLEHICDGLQKAERFRDKSNTKKECLEILKLAMYYTEKGKGILWLAEKLYQTAIAIASQHLIDGGRQKGCCKYHYAKFLLDKFPGADTEEPFLILTEVRDCAIGKNWPLYEAEADEEVPPDSIFAATAIQLHRVLLSKARAVRKNDPGKAERLSRLAERRARDADETNKIAEAIIEIGISQLVMNNLNNAQKTFERAFKIHSESGNVQGLCETRMHLAAVMQRHQVVDAIKTPRKCKALTVFLLAFRMKNYSRLNFCLIHDLAKSGDNIKMGDHESAARLLTEMGALAMKNGLRRQLGRALHLLGELHLRRERPELGTQHLSEAFACFMGFNFIRAMNQTKLNTDNALADNMEVIYNKCDLEIYEEEADQSRLMMAISAGQELMASYFNLIRAGRFCAVAKMKTIEWKLARAGWWVKRKQDDLMPCMCKDHNRTPLDVIRIKLEMMALESISKDFSLGAALLEKGGTQTDITALRSSFQFSQNAFSSLNIN